MSIVSSLLKGRLVLNIPSALDLGCHWRKDMAIAWIHTNTVFTISTFTLICSVDGKPGQSQLDICKLAYQSKDLLLLSLLFVARAVEA